MKEHARALLSMGICVTLLGAGTYYFLTKETPSTVRYAEQDDTQTDSIKSPIEVPVLERVTKNVDDPVNHASYDVEYPIVKMTSHGDLAKDASVVIDTYVGDRISEFLQAIQADTEGAMIDGPESSLTIRYSPTLLSPTIISIRFEVSEYWSGAAHPNSQTMIFNYDLEQHTILGSAGLFSSSTEALAVLAELSKTNLYEQFTNISDAEFREQVLPGITPTLENFRSIALTKEGLAVVFDPYQVAPYARGTQSVRLPLAQVGDLLTPRVREAIRLADTNIVEAVPMDSTAL